MPWQSRRTDRSIRKGKQGMGHSHLWRYNCVSQRINYIKACKWIFIQDNFEHCVQMMGGLRNTTHQVYTANMVVFNQKPLLRYEWVEEANVFFWLKLGHVWGYSYRSHWGIRQNWRAVHSQRRIWTHGRSRFLYQVNIWQHDFHSRAWRFRSLSQGRRRVKKTRLDLNLI